MLIKGHFYMLVDISFNDFVRLLRPSTLASRDGEESVNLDVLLHPG